MTSASGIAQATHSQSLVRHLPQIYLIFIAPDMKSTHPIALPRPQIDNSNFCSLLFFFFSPHAKSSVRYCGSCSFGMEKLSMAAARKGAFDFIRQARGGAPVRSSWPSMLPPWQPSVQSPSGLALSLRMRIEGHVSQHSYF